MITSVVFMRARADSWWAERGQGQAGLRPVAARPLTTVGSTNSGGRMNDPEEIMSNALRSSFSTRRRGRRPSRRSHGRSRTNSFAVHVENYALASPQRFTIADQVIRSASSVPANLSEGHGRAGRDRMHHWRIAYASAKEVDTHLRLLAQAGAVDKYQTDAALELFDRVRAMTWRLLNPKG